MKALLQTHSVSFAESIRIALDAAGIDAVVLDEQSAAALSFAGRIRVAVENDADYDRAMAIVRTFSVPTSPPLPSWRWHKRGLTAMGVGMLTMLGAVTLAGTHYIRWVALAGGIVFFTGVAFIGVGYRQDAKVVPGVDSTG